MQRVPTNATRFVCFLAVAVLRLDAAEPGTKLWEFQSAGRIYSSPAIGPDGAVYFGSLDRQVYALNPDGSRRWLYTTRGGVASSPAIGADGTVYIGSQDRRLYALSPRGELRWEFLAGGEIDSSPAVAPDGTICVGADDFHVYALAPDGRLKWSFATRGQVFSSPAIGNDGVLYVGSRDGSLYAVRPDGTKSWEFATRDALFASPAIGLGGTIYVGSRDGRLYALNPDGSRRWEFAAGSGILSSPVVGPDGTIFFAAHNAVLYALAPDGTLRWQRRAGGGISYSSMALAADGALHVGLDDGRLAAFNADGSPRWTFETGSPVEFSSPVLAADGTVYFGANNGKLYALAGSSGLASGPWPAFRRDAVHSGSGFVDRQLPAAYSGGAKTVVTLHATPPAGVAYYVVEDSPPAGWQVSDISHNGFYDAGGRRLRFGPFFDAQPRDLTYVATPPLNESGAKTFFGASATREGGERLIGGVQRLEMVPLHPADAAPVDGWMTLVEATAYGAAWKQGKSWPLPPALIPSSYLARAITLWQQGETYRQEVGFGVAPFWWTPSATNHLSPGMFPPPVPEDRTSPKGAATVEMSKTFQAGEPFTVTIQATPQAGVLVWAVEARPPDGWRVTEISHGGLWDAARAKVKWGPFFDSDARALRCVVTPPADAAGAARFGGAAAFDDEAAALQGRRVTYLAGTIAPPTLGAVRVNADTGAVLRVTGLPGETYLIQVSTDLVHWQVLGAATTAEGAADFQDPALPAAGQRFYRAVWP